MALPEGFQFTQGKLQDFADCPRRFELRHLLEQPWPAELIDPADEVEEHIRQGAAFHKLIHQHLLGLPEDQLSRMASEEPLIRWWQHFLEWGLRGLPGNRRAEVEVGDRFAGHPLVAKYDLIAFEGEGPIVIVDWKTNRIRPGRSRLARRLQTIVYPYVLARVGEALLGRSIRPDEIEMCYWFAEYPQDPERFAYSQDAYERDKAAIEALVEAIMAAAEGGGFPRTEDTRRCRFCEYRSLCERGERPGNVYDLEIDYEELEEWPAGLDWEEIAEVPF